MIGTRMRYFSPLSNLSLEELVPKDNFYRLLLHPSLLEN